MTEDKTLTTASGIPVADNQNSLTAGERGPILMQDFYLMEKLAHFNRERILNALSMQKEPLHLARSPSPMTLLATPKLTYSQKWANKLRFSCASLTG